MARRDLGKTPISEDSPAGQDVRNDPDFEALSREIEKMSSPTLSGTMDWNRVLQLSEDILTNKSKDLLVLSYFSVALLKTAGLRGFALSVKILRESLEAFWEDMFPVKKRMRGRKNA
ncbi:MAG: type VI secretion system ImpA family N-terminal domain-containing protein, partial [Syntrophales bacterium]